jgi:very-short-patch-repair endonuclease
MFERDRPTNPTRRARGLRRRMTRAEQVMWRELRKLDANFRRQAPIGRYFADFAAHGPCVVVEVDGEIHERLDEVVLGDWERQTWLESQGYRVLRFSNRQIEADVWGCIDQVKALLLDGGGLGGGVSAELG